MAGFEVYMLDLSNSLLKKGYTPVVLAWEPSKPESEVMRGITIQRFHMPSLFTKYRYPQIAYLSIRIIFSSLRHNIRIIHAHDYLPGLAASLAGKILRVPVAVTFHLPINKTSWRTRSKTSPSNIIEYLLQKFYIKNVSVTLCVCKFTLFESLKLGFPQNKLKVIYSWTRKEDLAKTENKDKVLQKYEMKKRPFALSVGRLDEKQKAFSLLINAFKILGEKHIDLDLVLVGKGPDEVMYKRLIQKRALQTRIHLLGKVSDEELACLYKSCDLFVLSSNFEALPLVLLEAMSYGKPVVATNTGGTNEIIENNLNGVLVETNTESIVKGIERIVSSPELKKKLGDAAKDTVNKKFSNKNIDEVIQVLKMLSEGKPLNN